MKKIAYRVDLEKIDGTYCGSHHFDSLKEAENFGKLHQDFNERHYNLVSFKTKRLYTVWETKLTA